MSDTILAALISASASILVALLSKAQQSHSPKARTAYLTSGGRRSGWYVTLGLLLVWLALSPAFLHHDFAGNNFLAIPAITLILALAAPISPLTSVWVVLALYAMNFIVGPLSNRLAGSRYDAQFGGFDLGPLLALAFANAAIVAGVCALRLRRPAVRTPSCSKHGTDGGSGAVDDVRLTSELEKLAQLHASGTLTDDEFRRAKERLLG